MQGKFINPDYGKEEYRVLRSDIRSDRNLRSLNEETCMMHEDDEGLVWHNPTPAPGEANGVVAKHQRSYCSYGPGKKYRQISAEELKRGLENGTIDPKNVKVVKKLRRSISPVSEKEYTTSRKRRLNASNFLSTGKALPTFRPPVSFREPIKESRYQKQFERKEEKPLPQYPKPLPQYPKPLPQYPKPLPQYQKPLPQYPKPLPQYQKPLPSKFAENPKIETKLPVQPRIENLSLYQKGESKKQLTTGESLAQPKKEPLRKKNDFNVPEKQQTKNRQTSSLLIPFDVIQRYDNDDYY
jgi:hypothetical protein